MLADLPSLLISTWEKCHVRMTCLKSNFQKDLKFIKYELSKSFWLKANGIVLLLLSLMLKKIMKILSQGLLDKWINYFFENHSIFGPLNLLGQSCIFLWALLHIIPHLPVCKLGFMKRNRAQTLSMPLSWFIYQVSLSLSLFSIAWRMPGGGSAWCGRPLCTRFHTCMVPWHQSCCPLLAFISPALKHSHL